MSAVECDRIEERLRNIEEVLGLWANWMCSDFGHYRALMAPGKASGTQNFQANMNACLSDKFIVDDESDDWRVGCCDAVIKDLSMTARLPGTEYSGPVLVAAVDFYYGITRQISFPRVDLDDAFTIALQHIGAGLERKGVPV